MSPELEDQAALYVLDQLNAEQRAAFEARLLTDAALATLVRDMQHNLDRRVHALPSVPPGRNVFAGIERRIDELTTPKLATPRRFQSEHWATVARWGIAAVIALSLGTIAVQQVRRGTAGDRPVIIVVGLDPAQTTSTQFTLPERPRDSDASFIQLASLAEQYWEKPQNLPTALPVSKSTNGGQGYAVYDPASNQGFIGVRNLPPLDPGKRYHLWLVDPGSGKFQQAGSIPVGSSSGGLYSFSVPVGGKNGSIGFFVTVEDAGEPSSSPRGQVVLGQKGI